MKNIFILSLLLIFSVNTIAQKDTIYAEIDLKNLEQDRVNVTLEFSLNSDSEYKRFYFPISTQGTYEDAKFSKYCKNFKIFDENNNPLIHKKEIIRSIIIDEDNKRISIGEKRSKEFYFIPNQTKTIRYQADDCYDIGVNKYPNFVPVACIFEKDKVYQINWGSLLGGFVSKENSVYKVRIIKPDKFYGATALQKKIINDTLEYVYAQNYDELVNSPVFYTIPDTTVLQIGGSEIEISVFSENGKTYSKSLAKEMEAFITEASKSYLKGIMPDKYVFMFYFTNGFGFGALEHKTSSLYFLNVSFNSKDLSRHIPIAAHEFLHILTPLTLRSNRIDNFKFYAPYSSKHLWLYEGVTEYFSQLILLKTNDKRPISFLFTLEDNYKCGNKKTSLERLSENIYQKKWNKKYELVYSKGSFTAFALDMEIYKLTNGEKRLYDIIVELKERYKTKAFKDEELIDEFVNICGKDELHSFFDKYIIGKKSLPINDYLLEIGVELKMSTDTLKYKTNGLFSSIYFKNDKVYIRKPSKKHYPNVNGGRKLQIVSINGDKNVIANQRRMWQINDGEYIEYMYKGEKHKIVVESYNSTKVRTQKRIVKVAKATDKQKDVFKEFLYYDYKDIMKIR